MQRTTPQAFLSHTTALVDVRSPLEFERGHIPGAHNLPLFTDAERAQVGIRYKQGGREPAFLLGLEMVGPKMANFVRQARKLGPALRLYCFRGGARSSSLGWLFDSAGFTIEVLEGGYKAYRFLVHAAFAEPQKMLVLGGPTGAGKTRLLQILRTRGENVIDLEGLAHHRGSAFGTLAEQQPTTEQFENDLGQHWLTLNRTQTVWLEDECKTIGRISLPEPLWAQMRNAQLLFLDLPQAERIRHLLEDYGTVEPCRLIECAERIAPRLGPQRIAAFRAAVEMGNYAEGARITLDYYDSAYLFGMSKRDPERVKRVLSQDEVLSWNSISPLS